MTDDEFTEKSRTRLKKEAHALQRIGERLAGLSDDQLDRMELPGDLRQALTEVKTMHSHGARRRQMQFIGGIMRNVDITPIEQALLEIEQGALGQARAFHRLEAWRDQLVAGDDVLMEEILATVPAADRQRLGQLVRSARKAQEKENAPNKSARHLFRYLKSIADQ